MCITGSFRGFLQMSSSHWRSCCGLVVCFAGPFWGFSQTSSLSWRSHYGLVVCIAGDSCRGFIADVFFDFALTVGSCRCLLYLCAHVVDWLCELQPLAVGSLQTSSVSWLSHCGLVVCLAGSYRWFITVVVCLGAHVVDWCCASQAIAVGSMPTSSWS